MLPFNACIMTLLYRGFAFFPVTDSTLTPESFSSMPATGFNHSLHLLTQYLPPPQLHDYSTRTAHRHCKYSMSKTEPSRIPTNPFFAFSFEFVVTSVFLASQTSKPGYHSELLLHWPVISNFQVLQILLLKCFLNVLFLSQPLPSAIDDVSNCCAPYPGGRPGLHSCPLPINEWLCHQMTYVQCKSHQGSSVVPWLPVACQRHPLDPKKHTSQSILCSAFV